MELEVEDVEAMPSLEDDDASPEDSGSDDKKDGKPDAKSSDTVSRDEFLELKKSFEATQKERDELRESERYWSERARAGKPEAKQEEEEEDDLADLLAGIKDDDGDNDKFIDELTGEGAAAIKKRGFVTKKEALELAREVAERVAAKASKKAVGAAEKKLQRESKLIREFPFIENEKSEEFQLAAKYFRAAVDRNPAKASDPDALWDAAEKARDVIAERKAAEKAKRGDKKARMAAQADAGGGSGMDGDDDEMSDLEKQTARRFGITEKEYRAHRTVNIGGIPGMRG